MGKEKNELAVHRKEISGHMGQRRMDEDGIRSSLSKLQPTDVWMDMTPDSNNSLIMDTLQRRQTGDAERKVCKFIDSVLELVLDELSKPDGYPTVAMGPRPSHPASFLNPDTGALESNGSNAIPRVYSWLGKTPQEAWRFGVIIRILGSVSEAIRGGFISSKRDIFYQDPLYFGSQGVVDRCVDDIACTAGVDRAALHVEAAAKGLVAGCFKIVLKDGTEIDVGSHVEGMLIPRVNDVHEVRLCDIRWVLVVEKEAVFHRLATSAYYKTSAAGKGILITGKGYPDISTRAFLRLLSLSGRPSFTGPQVSEIPSLLSSNGLTPPISVLVDGDPDGIAIMSTYKYGSKAHLHENANLNVREMEWLAIPAAGIASGTESACDGSLMPLSLRDRKKAVAMLARCLVFADDGPEPKWRAELQRMLFTNFKAEIEILYELKEGIEGWLDKKLQEMT